MSYINTLFGNYNSNILRKTKCLSMDITENNTDKIFLKSPFDKIPKTKIPSIKKEIYIIIQHYFISFPFMDVLMKLTNLFQTSLKYSKF